MGKSHYLLQKQISKEFKQTGETEHCAGKAHLLQRSIPITLLH